MSMLYWVILGLLAGFLAKLIVGGRSGWIMTLVLGLVGSFVGGFIAQALHLNALPIAGINAMPLIVATVGAIIVLFVYHKVKGL